MSPLHQCYCRTLFLGVLWAFLTAMPSPPDVTTAGQGNSSLSYGSSVQSLGPCLPSKSPVMSPELVFPSEKTTSGGEGRPQRDPRHRLRGHRRTRTRGQPMLPASSRSPVPPCYCSTAINPREVLEFRAGFYRREPGVQEPRSRLAFPC